MISIVGSVIGGLGLFLLAVAMITDGLKLAAGQALRSILSGSTSTRLRGVASGVLVTAVVQSSSAVTVAIIGFVNAGLVSLPQALGIVYGANIGTTMTGWIVAALGFDFKIEVVALPLIGLGMMLRLLRPDTRLAALGTAIAGFGLFFIGVDVLREAFEVFATRVDVAAFAPQGGAGIVLYVVLGFFMTVLTQSSSAAIAITLTAATGGLLTINVAAAMVIGANLGTTSTAAFAVIGATANAKRVAAAHVVFNALTAFVAVGLLPVLMTIVANTGRVLGFVAEPAVTLALFHTVFNVLGLAVMWPLSNRLARFLAGRFTTDEELLATPRYLDRNVMKTPDLAVAAVIKELERVAEAARESATAVISAEVPGALAEKRQRGALALLDAIETFVTDLQMQALPEARRGDLPNMLRVCGYLEEVAGLALEVQERREDIEAVLRPPVFEAVSAYQANVVSQLEAVRSEAGVASAELDARYATLREQYHDLKTALLQGAAHRQLPVDHLNPALEGLRDMLKMAEQMTKVAGRLRMLVTAPTADAGPSVPEPPAAVDAAGAQPIDPVVVPEPRVDGPAAAGGASAEPDAPVERSR